MKKELSMKKQAEEFVVNVNRELMNVRTSFIKIGYWLETAKNLQYYKQLKFNNFEEMAENLFGFKKSTAYGLCAVWDNFHDKNNKESIDERFKEFNYSQLLELSRNCYNAPGLLKIVKPSDSVVDIRKFITFWNKYAQQHSTTPDGSSIKEIFETYKVGVLETPALPNIEKQEKSNYIEVIQDSSAIDVTKRLESSNSQNISNNFEETSEEFFQISGNSEGFEDIANNEEMQSSLNNTFQISGKFELDNKSIYSKFFVKEQPNFKFFREFYILYFLNSNGFEFLKVYKCLGEAIDRIKLLDTADFVELYHVDSFSKMTPVFTGEKK